MDPSSTLMAVAQIFSLIADYAAEKRASQHLDVHDFTQWLAMSCKLSLAVGSRPSVRQIT